MVYFMIIVQRTIICKKYIVWYSTVSIIIMPCYSNILGYICTCTQIYCSFILVHKPVLFKGKRNRILHNSDHKYAKISVYVLQYDSIGKVLYVVQQTWTAYCVCAGWM